MSLSVELISSSGEFEALEKDWNALSNECSYCKIFNSWDWMFTWWTVFNKEVSQQLYILCVFDQNKNGKTLIGIAPFYILKKQYPQSFVMGKTLQFIGNGEPEEEMILSQYNDLIVCSGREEQVCEQLSVYLQQHKSDWDCADFPYLLKNSLLQNCFVKSTACFHFQCIKEGFRSYISPVENFEAYRNTLANRWAKMYRKKDRLLKRDGEVLITTTTTEESVDEALGLLAKMHGERWRDVGCANKFDEERFFEFHQKILRHLVPQHKAFIKTLYLNDEPLASYYAFSDNGEVYYYQSGFFLKFANRYSPLFLLVCKEIGLSNSQNKLFDFMYTDTDNSYKQVQYAAKSENMYRLLVSRTKFRLVLFNTLKSVKDMYLKICDAIKFPTKNRTIKRTRRQANGT